MYSPLVQKLLSSHIASLTAEIGKRTAAKSAFLTNTLEELETMLDTATQDLAQGTDVVVSMTAPAEPLPA